jgi:glycosyltransferase involved in cell wall biosynthesis
MSLTFLLPVFNERATVEQILQNVEDSGLADRIIIVDDASTDGTRELLQEIAARNPQVELHLHDRNQGKGAALRTGFGEVETDLVLVQDADLEYDPRDVPGLLVPLEENKADVVYGSRFLGAARRPTMFWHMVANKMLTLMTNVLYNSILTDMETGYKLFRREVIQDITIRSNRFDFEPVPITFNPREYSEGKKIGFSDAFAAVWALLKFRFVD